MQKKRRLGRIVMKPLATTLLVFFHAIFLVQPALATSIIAVRVKGQVIIGADSKRLHADDGVPFDEPVCKIGKAEGFFFAVGGVATDSETGFIPASVIITASKMQGTIEQKVDKIEDMIKEPLIRVLDRFRQEHPLGYGQRFGTGSALQIIFFGVENGYTFVLVSDFIPTPSLSAPVQLNIKRYNCPGVACPTGEQIFIGGYYDAIKRFLTEKPDYWRENTVEAVRRLIELEIEDVPDNVGPPIDILRVDMNGGRWIQKKEQCPDF